MGCVAPGPQLQAQFAVDPMRLFESGDESMAAQHQADPTVAETTALDGDRLEPLDQRRFIGSSQRVLRHRSRTTGDEADHALAQPRSCNALTVAFRWEGPRGVIRLVHRVVLEREFGDDPTHTRVLVVDGSSVHDFAVP